MVPAVIGICLTLVSLVGGACDDPVSSQAVRTSNAIPIYRKTIDLQDRAGIGLDFIIPQCSDFQGFERAT